MKKTPCIFMPSRHFWMSLEHPLIDRFTTYLAEYGAPCILFHCLLIGHCHWILLRRAGGGRGV